MSNNNEKLVKDIRRRTRKKYSSEEKIRIVLEGMRGEESMAELCRREGLNQNGWASLLLYYIAAAMTQETGNGGCSPLDPPLNSARPDAETQGFNAAA